MLMLKLMLILILSRSSLRNVSRSQNILSTATWSRGVCWTPTMTRPRQSPDKLLLPTVSGKNDPGDGVKLEPRTRHRSHESLIFSALCNKSLRGESLMTGLVGSNHEPLKIIWIEIFYKFVFSFYLSSITLFWGHPDFCARPSKLVVTISLARSSLISSVVARLL